MRLYRVRPRDLPSACWVGTQKEAKDLAREYGHGAAWTAVDVPTDKDGLLAFLNEVGAAASRSELADLRNFHSREAIEEFQRGDLTMEARPEPAALRELRRPPPAAAGTLTADAACDLIGTSKGSNFGHLLEASIRRLGELGQEGWAQLSSILKSPCYEANEKLGTGGLHKIERGLRLLALAQVREMDGESGQ